MDEYELSSEEVYKILKEKGLDHFYHANTVKTSLTFIDSLALLSREHVEQNGLNQTTQSSDETDREFGIWNYIFLDGKDLAAYFSQPNLYGPILFAFVNELLLNENIPTIRITKFNPYYWTNEHSDSDKYFNNLNDFRNAYLTGNKHRDGGIMFIITTLNGRFDFTEYLSGIRVDKTGVNVRRRDGQLEDYCDAIINEFKRRLGTAYSEQLQFVIRNNYSFRNIYLWYYQRRRTEFNRLFNP